MQRMCRALSEYIVAGIKTNIGFHKRVLNHPVFREGDHDTTFVDTHMEQLMHAPSGDEELAVMAAAVFYYLEHRPATGPGQPVKCSGWKHYQRQHWM